MRLPEKNKGLPPPKVWLKNLRRLLAIVFRHHALRLVAVAMFIIISVLANVAGSLFLEVLIDDHIAPLLQMSNPVWSGLLRTIGIMAMIYLAGICATFLFNILMVDISQGVLKDIRNRMFAHMQTLPVSYFDSHSHGDLMSRYTNDTDTLRQMISQSLPQMFSSLITIVMVVTAMLVTSLHLSAVVFISVLLMLIITRTIAGKSSKYFKAQQKALGETNGYIEEMIHGQKVVKVFCHEEETKADFDQLNESLAHHATEANRYANILMPVMGNLSHLQYVIIAIFGGAFAIGGIGGITIGIIASFLQLSRTLSMPINQVSQQLNSVIMALAGADRVFNLMDEQPETDQGYVRLVHAKKDRLGNLVEAGSPTGLWAWRHPHADGSVTYTELTGAVRFHDVDFSYDGKTTVLKNINLDAEPGQKTAFVGATGAGKTTITNLINRFYDLDDGKIRYDDININKIRKPDLRRSLGMVLQDTHLFTGTVRDNIRYGRLDATDEEIEAAARRANAHGFISMLPQGYDTVLSGDGSGLSQGQRQLLSIARAEVADAPVMILDEATSSIDTRTEAIVQKGMDALMRGRTVFVIAHRLSTVQNADMIMVLEQGEIIERGSHQDLIEAGGTYYQLYTGAVTLV